CWREEKGKSLVEIWYVMAMNAGVAELSSYPSSARRRRYGRAGASASRGVGQKGGILPVPVNFWPMLAG
ncbi:hypothetical protein, partial [Halomonas fontilapidosi]|uniref:hypothetical protein n=1 Tax=Halomonas fontilapidosi TaxID=616675 RepID=UPI001C85A190